jgi:hypothetical protein
MNVIQNTERMVDSSVLDPEVFWASGSVIICTDPDPSITKQKN